MFFCYALLLGSLFPAEFLFMLVMRHSTFRGDIEILTLTSLFLDIDECAAQVNPCNAVANSECKNTDGYYNCQCKDGYVKNGPNCEGTTQFLSLLLILISYASKFI